MSFDFHHTSGFLFVFERGGSFSATGDLLGLCQIDSERIPLALFGPDLAYAIDLSFNWLLESKTVFVRFFCFGRLLAGAEKQCGNDSECCEERSFHQTIF